MNTAPVDDGVTLFAADGTMFHLNPTGAAILADLITGGIERAVATLTGQYGITDDRARSDVGALLTNLRDRRLMSR